MVLKTMLNELLISSKCMGDLCIVFVVAFKCDRVRGKIAANSKNKIDQLEVKEIDLTYHMMIGIRCKLDDNVILHHKTSEIWNLDGRRYDCKKNIRKTQRLQYIDGQSCNLSNDCNWRIPYVR